MNRLFLFNPENDLALAAGTAAYTPPAAAARLRDAGAMLPWWLGDAGDAVLVPPGRLEAAAAFAESVAAVCGPGPRVVARADEEVARCVPWGWSLYALRRFEQAGVAFSPGAADMCRELRALSHRRVSAEISRALARYNEEHGGVLGALPPVPAEVGDVRGLPVLADRWGELYVKAPWSSTGRGVFSSAGMSMDELCRRAAGTIARQGSVMVEKGLRKVVDFAMLFRGDEAGVRQIGYSLFFTGHGTAYGGNVLLPDSEIERRLAAYVPVETLRGAADALERVLGTMVGGVYRGCFGVDMMVCRGDGGRFLLAPCVELNLRLTMGVVARALVRRFANAYSRMVVAPVSAGIPAGAMWLVPPGEDFFIGLVP